MSGISLLCAVEWPYIAKVRESTVTVIKLFIGSPPSPPSFSLPPPTYKKKIFSPDPNLIKNVLSHWSEDFTSHAGHMTGHLMHQYYTTCATLHRLDHVSNVRNKYKTSKTCFSCLEEGMIPSLDMRDVARLHGVWSLLFLSFPTATTHETTPIELIKGRAHHIFSNNYYTTLSPSSFTC